MKKKYFIFSLICSVLSAFVIIIAVWLPGSYQVPVLMYHSVAPQWHEPLNNVRPESFRWQIAYLKEHGYQVISAAAFVEAKSTAKPLPPRAVVITFDDGYENNYTAAYPLLKAAGFPATFFVEAGRVDTAGRFSWSQAKEMYSSGIAIESHTLSGAYLPDLAHEQLIHEITESKRVLEEGLGVPVTLFAYPIGGFSEDIKTILHQAGYKAAFTTNRGFDRAGKDLFELKRIRIKDSDRDAQFWLKLSGYYNIFRSSQKPF